MKKAVIFDLYFTLIFPDIFDEEYASIGLSAEQWMQYCESNDMIHLLSHGKEKTCEEVAERMAREIPFPVSPQALLCAHRRRVSRLLAQAKPELVEVLQTLRQRGYRIGLLSNADQIDRACWQESRLSRLFDAALISCEVGIVKPDEQIYRICADRLGVAPEECFFVGDGGSRELMGAKQVGMETVFTECLLVKSEEKRQKILQYADHTIREFSGLLSFT